MAKELNENVKFNISIKTIGGLMFGVATLAGMWFTLKADIQLAKELPAPTIERIEYDLKDKLVRQTIMDTQDDVETILDKLERLDDRIFKMQQEK